MRFMMLMIPGNQVPDDKDPEKGAMPSDEDIAAMMTYNEAMVKAGVLLGAEGLHSSANGARITWSGGKPRVTDGPFAESKEVIGGFWMIRVNSKDEAIAWAKRCPVGDGVTIELRQVFEPEEFSPEVAKQERALIEEIARGMDENQQRR
ncbi:MAG TPA: YciI family protein [Tepidiformaceae bacterium]|nr:YciI family protein [Tepidiformaceae bacterium]